MLKIIENQLGKKMENNIFEYFKEYIDSDIKKNFRSLYPRPGKCRNCGIKGNHIEHFTKNTFINGFLVFSLNSFIEESHYDCSSELIRLSDIITQEVKEITKNPPPKKENVYWTPLLIPVLRQNNCEKLVKETYPTGFDVVIVSCFYSIK